MHCWFSYLPIKTAYPNIKKLPAGSSRFQPKKVPKNEQNERPSADGPYFQPKMRRQPHFSHPDMLF